MDYLCYAGFHRVSVVFTKMPFQYQICVNLNYHLCGRIKEQCIVHSYINSVTGTVTRPCYVAMPSDAASGCWPMPVPKKHYCNLIDLFYMTLHCFRFNIFHKECQWQDSFCIISDPTWDPVISTLKKCSS